MWIDAGTINAVNDQWAVAVTASNSDSFIGGFHAWWVIFPIGFMLLMMIFMYLNVHARKPRYAVAGFRLG